jgi:hypothetical protein
MFSICFTVWTMCSASPLLWRNLGLLVTCLNLYELAIPCITVSSIKPETPPEFFQYCPEFFFGKAGCTGHANGPDGVSDSGAIGINLVKESSPCKLG